jgi:excinuclease ABC subunit A
VLDEPSIGLHQRGQRAALKTLFRLRDLGNSVIVVEHDEETIRAADHILDLGPGAGPRGGELVAEGTLAQVLKAKNSPTADYLSGRARIEIPKRRVAPRSNGREFGRLADVARRAREQPQRRHRVIPARLLHVRDRRLWKRQIDARDDTLPPRALPTFLQLERQAGAHAGLHGLDQLDKAIVIDQTAIGRTPRSIRSPTRRVSRRFRELFSQLPTARVRGYDAGRFSFNVKGGRCENCEGGGLIKIEMHFLPDVYVECEVCHGRRYNRETLEITFKGKNIATCSI